VIDRAKQDVIWFGEVDSPSVAYSSSGVYICGDRETVAFSFEGGRPEEVSRFYAAIVAGDLDGVRAGVAKWKESRLDAVWSDDPVSVAARNGQAAVLRYLISAGLSPDSTSAYDCTPLIAAIKRSQVKSVAVLLEAVQTPTDQAASGGHR
jgi:hypothetical protein